MWCLDQLILPLQKLAFSPTPESSFLLSENLGWLYRLTPQHLALAMNAIGESNTSVHWVSTSFLRKTVFRSSSATPRSHCAAKKVKENSFYECYCIRFCLSKWAEYPHISDRMTTYLDKSAEILAKWLPQAFLWERGRAKDTKLKWQTGMRGQWQAEMLGSVHTQPEMGTWKAGSAILAKSISDGSSEQVLGTHFLQLFCLHRHAEV